MSLELGLPRAQIPRDVSDNVVGSIKSGSFLPGEKKEPNVLLFCTPADNCWQYSSGTNSSKRNTVEKLPAVPPESVDLVEGSDLNSICKGKGR